MQAFVKHSVGFEIRLQEVLRIALKPCGNLFHILIAVQFIRYRGAKLVGNFIFLQQRDAFADGGNIKLRHAHVMA